MNVVLIIELAFSTAVPRECLLVESTVLLVWLLCVGNNKHANTKEFLLFSTLEYGCNSSLTSCLLLLVFRLALVHHAALVLREELTLHWYEFFRADWR